MIEIPSAQKLEDVDRQLLSEGVPLRYRPLDSFKKICGSVQDFRRRQELFAPITDWYLVKYGDSARWDGVIARFPLLIKGTVYLAPARFVAEGEVLANIEDEIEQLPKEILESISQDELRTILDKLSVAVRGFYDLYNLSVDDAWLGPIVRDLVRRASYDLENSAVTLRHTGDTQTAIVQAHEAAEKVLKAALARSDSTAKLRDFGHNVPKIFKMLMRSQPRYSCLLLPVENLQRLSPSMEMRYSAFPRSAAMAVEAYHGALFVCATIARMWLFDRARGTTKSRFKECSFYFDGANTFYCKQVKGNIAMLTLFSSGRLTGSRMADVTIKVRESALYLEVTDPFEDARLRLQLGAILRSAGPRNSPEESGVRTIHGPEGSYTTATFKFSPEEPEA